MVAPEVVTAEKRRADEDAETQKVFIKLEVLRHFLLTSKTIPIVDNFSGRRVLGQLAAQIDVPVSKIEEVLCPIFLEMVRRLFPSCNPPEVLRYDYSYKTAVAEIAHVAHRIFYYLVSTQRLQLNRSNIQMAIEKVSEYYNVPGINLKQKVAEYIRSVLDEISSEMFK